MDNHGHVCNKEIYRKAPSPSSHRFLDSFETLEPKLRKNSRKNTKNVFTVTSHYAFYAISIACPHLSGKLQQRIQLRK